MPLAEHKEANCTFNGNFLTYAPPEFTAEVVATATNIWIMVIFQSLTPFHVQSRMQPTLADLDKVWQVCRTLPPGHKKQIF